MEEQKDKVGYVKESCTANDGERTVIQGMFAPGAMAPMHYHTEFNESFEVLKGELSVWNDGKKIILGTSSSCPEKKRKRSVGKSTASGTSYPMRKSRRFNVKDCHREPSLVDFSGSFVRTILSPSRRLS